jgi:rRNA maturation endonuclease Nob1
MSLRPYSRCTNCGKRNVRTTKPEGKVCWRCVGLLKKQATAQQRKVKHRATYGVDPPS